MLESCVSCVSNDLLSNIPSSCFIPLLPVSLTLLFTNYTPVQVVPGWRRSNTTPTSDPRRSSNNLSGGGAQGEGKESVGAFLERCHTEYSNLMTYGNIEGSIARRYVWV